MKDIFCAFIVGLTIFSAVVGLGGGLKVVQWIGKRLGVKPFDC